ncbi:MAG: hypothetical protein KGY81_03220 [Phycisphaerae bacterium]|nr:hypothetical protein [Phycisphaerae bacterium]
MTKNRMLTRFAALSVAALLLCGTAVADPFHRWSPDLGRLKTSADVTTVGMPKHSSHGRDTELGWLDVAAKGFIPVMQRDLLEWSVQPHFSWRSMEGSAYLEDVGERLPDDLYEIGVGTTLRMKLTNGWIVGANLDISSPSDKPFASHDEMAISTTAFLQMPWKESLDLVAMVDLSNDRSFARCVPLPGGALHYYPSKEFDLFLGMPLSSVRWQPIDDLTLSARWLLLRDFNAKVSYRIFGPLSAYASFDWGSDTWLRHDRHHEAHRLTYRDKRVAAGLRWFVSDNVWVDASAGWAWDRFWYEGEDYSDRDKNRIKLEDGCFGQLRVGVRF